MNSYQEAYDKIVSVLNTENVRKIDEYLKSTDFFTAPASKKYHHSYEGGLLEHCVEVFKYIREMSNIVGIEVSNEMRYILAFGHDISKTNFYVKTPSRVNIHGEWQTTDKYVVEDKLGLPHQIASLHLLKKLVDIDLETEKAILYHHGAFEESTKEEYCDSTAKDPYTFILHTADNISCILNEKNRMPAIRDTRGW